MAHDAGHRCDDHPGHAHAHAHGQGHGHGHAHGLALAQFDRAMACGVGLNLAFVAIEAVAGFWAGSLALLADAGHNAGDVLGLLLAWGAAWLARRPPSPRYTWGLRRATIYAALANAVLLLVACGAIIWEAVHRLRDAEPVAVAADEQHSRQGVDDHADRGDGDDQRRRDGLRIP
jgi:cobalt-zinc-cadmium efflux system protein